MKTIMPPTIEKTMPKTRSVKTGCRIANPTSPPIGSVSPDSSDHPKAFHLLPVAYSTGIATQSPSGTLWTAMATPREAPTFSSSRVARKVASPSGKLCIPMARAVSNPIRASLFFSLSDSSIFWSSALLAAPPPSSTMLTTPPVPPTSTTTPEAARSACFAALMPGASASPSVSPSPSPSSEAVDWSGVGTSAFGSHAHTVLGRPWECPSSEAPP
mmetsp:Transcript_14662/g.47089  ORF Transcript_14662/g.47089 Transcript_14662/m.47089 type:complete len:215 (+) Transcript_14662:297-941(+)